MEEVQSVEDRGRKLAASDWELGKGEEKKWMRKVEKNKIKEEE